MLRNLLLSAVLGLSAVLAGPAATFAAAASPVPSPAPSTDPRALAILQAIERQNPTLQTFQARLHVQVRMQSFPWLAPKLDGTAYYKRPGNYEIVFDRVPSYAHGITHLFGDIADPSGWLKLWNVRYAGAVQQDGHTYYELSMTKKIYSDQIKQTLAFVDARSLEVRRMEWDYTNGGQIVMTQTYGQEGPYSVVTAQHADIHIPHVRATLDAQYREYETNVALNDSVFRK